MVKVAVCSRGDRDSVGVKEGGEWGGGIPLPIRLEGLGERRELPSGVRGGARPKMNLVRFICPRTLLVEGKSNLFIHNYSGTNKQKNKN